MFSFNYCLFSSNFRFLQYWKCGIWIRTFYDTTSESVTPKRPKFGLVNPYFALHICESVRWFTAESAMVHNQKLGEINRTFDCKMIESSVTTLELSITIIEFSVPRNCLMGRAAPWNSNLPSWLYTSTIITKKNETKSREQDHEHQKEMASSACANESALVLDNQHDLADDSNSWPTYFCSVCTSPSLKTLEL